MHHRLIVVLLILALFATSILPSSAETSTEVGVEYTDTDFEFHSVTDEKNSEFSSHLSVSYDWEQPLNDGSVAVNIVVRNDLRIPMVVTIETGYKEGLQGLEDILDENEGKLMFWGKDNWYRRVVFRRQNLTGCPDGIDPNIARCHKGFDIKVWPAGRDNNDTIALYGLHFLYISLIAGFGFTPSADLFNNVEGGALAVLDLIKDKLDVVGIDWLVFGYKLGKGDIKGALGELAKNKQALDILAGRIVELAKVLHLNVQISKEMVKNVASLTAAVEHGIELGRYLDDVWYARNVGGANAHISAFYVRKKVPPSPTPMPGTPVPTPVETVPATPIPFTPRQPTPTPIACNPLLPGVILYSELDYGPGRCTHLTASHGNLGQLAVGDNAVSSIRINGNYQVKFYKDVNYGGGPPEEVNHSDPDLDKRSLGGQYSSIKIIERVECEDEDVPGVILYADKDFEGACVHLTGNEDDLGRTAVGDDNVSSVRVNGDYKLTLFEDKNRQGPSDEINHDDANLDDNSLGGKYSSARVEKPVGCSDTTRPGVYLYSEKRYKGNCAYVTGDVDDLDDTPVGNDGPRSLRIVGDFEITLYEDRGFGGRAERLSTDQDDLTWRSLGDQYSSVRIRAKSRAPAISFNQANEIAIQQNGQAIWTTVRDWSFAGTASDPDNDLARVEFHCEGDTCNETAQLAGDATNWSYSRTGLEGKNRISFRAYDAAGQASSPDDRYYVDLYVDLAAPVTTLSLNRETAPEHWPPWFTQAVQVQLDAQDGNTGNARAGVAAIYYQIDGGAIQEVQGAHATFVVEADGEHRIDYYALDKVGNRETTKNAAFLIDRTFPTLPTAVTESQGVVDNQWQKAYDSPVFTWQPATDNFSGVWGYQFYFGDNPNGEVAHVTVTAEEEAKWVPQPAGVRTGTYYLRGRTRDNAGNWSGWATLFTYRYDGTPPENPEEATHAAGIGNETWQRTTSLANFTWPVPHDEGSGIKGYSVFWGTDPQGTSSEFAEAVGFQSNTPLCSVDAACTGYLRVRSLDNVDNAAEDWSTVFTLRYDNAPPALDFTFFGGLTQTAQTLVTLNIAATDQGSGAKAMHFSNDGSTWTEWEAYAAERIWQIPAIGRQSWPVYAQVRDGVGLESPVVMHEVYLEVNREQPRSANYRLFDYAASAGVGAHTSPSYVGQSTVGQTIDSVTATSTYFRLTGGYQAGSQAIPLTVPSHDEFTFVNGIFASGVVAPTMTSESFHMLASVGEPGLPNGVTTIASDNFRHQPGFLAAIPAPVQLRPIPVPEPGPPPQADSVPDCEFPQISINNGAVFTNNPTVYLRICAPHAVEMMLSNDGGFGGVQWEPYAAEKTWTLTTLGQYVLPRFVYAAFKDANGAVHGTYFDEIIYDPEPPTGFISTGDGVPVEMATRSDYAAGTALHVRNVAVAAEGVGEELGQPLLVATTNENGAVDLYLSARDAVGNVDAMQLSDRFDFQDAPWESYTALRPWTPPGEDGISTVYVRFRDEAGNASDAISSEFVVDTVAPDGAMYIADRVISPGTATVRVYLATVDNLTEVADMRISTDPTFADAAWQPYAWSLNWPVTAQEQGVYVLYVQYRDIAGNISAAYSDQYQIDASPPLLYVQVGPGESASRSLFVAAYDAESRVETVYLTNDPLWLEGVVSMPYDKTIGWTFDERGIVWVQVEDSVGNRSELYAASTAEDQIVPPPQGLYLPIVGNKFMMPGPSPDESRQPTFLPVVGK